MNSQHMAIRAQISVMCYDRAVDYLSAFHLPKDEESFILEREVNKMSIVGIAQKYNVSESYVRDKRKMAFARISDAITYGRKKAQ